MVFVDTAQDYFSIQGTLCPLSEKRTRQLGDGMTFPFFQSVRNPDSDLLLLQEVTGLQDTTRQSGGLATTRNPAMASLAFCAAGSGQDAQAATGVRPEAQPASVPGQHGGMQAQHHNGRYGHLPEQLWAARGAAVLGSFQGAISTRDNNGGRLAQRIGPDDHTSSQMGP